MSNASHLVLRDIRKTYGSECVLNGVSLDVREGEYLVILGPSGCGKSTLLQIIAGLVRADSGRVELSSRSLDRTSPGDRDVSILFQDDRLYPHWTLRQSLQVACDRSPVQGKVTGSLDQMVERLGIGSQLDRRPDEVSGGQLRRAALAKALLRQPAVCLLDEPLTAIDTMLREELLSLLSEYPRSRGDSLSQTSIVHITHDGDEAMRLADRIAVMGQGRVLQFDAPEFVYRNPKTLGVAKALGTPPANLLPLRWVQSTFSGQFESTVNAVSCKRDDSVLVVRPENVQWLSVEQKKETPDAALQFEAQVVSSRYVGGRYVSQVSPLADPETRLTLFSPGDIAASGDAGLVRIPFSELICVPAEENI
ncbi:MAG: ABC transporter ATP-binding protein [Rhodopirellula sp. JB044]|uniref:ABC transporter ATP-binding protein n=1 Tax=Rhodopirellula sp. JB044 TaxID=3342844 RepID=UPI00370C8875